MNETQIKIIKEAINNRTDDLLRAKREKEHLAESGFSDLDLYIKMCEKQIEELKENVPE